MYITFTDSAKNRLAALRSNLEGRLHLYYDTEEKAVLAKIAVFSHCD